MENLNQKQKKYLNIFINEILKIDNKNHMKDFILGILTPKELKDIPSRLQIIKNLKKGITHQKIAKKLEIGVATVTRGSKELQKGRFKYIK